MMDIPRVDPVVLVGFLETLENLGGKSSMGVLEAQLYCTIEKLLPMLDSGEMFGLLEVHVSEVSITEKGRLFIKASPNTRKQMIHEMIVNLDIFKTVIDLIKKSRKGRITKNEMLKIMPEDDFDWIIEWGRATLILDYDANVQTVSLRQRLM
jgi:hypothetical protein